MSNFFVAETILIFFSGSIILTLIFLGAVWLLKQSIKKLLEQEVESYKNELSKELELYKKELDLKHKHLLKLQEERRKLFEDFSNSLENFFTENDDLSLKLNKLFGLLALYAPDDVYISLRNSLNGMTIPNDVKPEIYYTLRKSLFGEETKLSKDDLVKHIKANKINITLNYEMTFPCFSSHNDVK